jgi:hypothetical protein
MKTGTPFKTSVPNYQLNWQHTPEHFNLCRCRQNPKSRIIIFNFADHHEGCSTYTLHSDDPRLKSQHGIYDPY